MSNKHAPMEINDADLDVSAGGDDHFTETLSLNYAKIPVEFAKPKDSFDAVTLEQGAFASNKNRSTR